MMSTSASDARAKAKVQVFQLPCFSDFSIQTPSFSAWQLPPLLPSRIREQRKVSFHNVEHEFAQSLRAGATLTYARFSFGEPRLCDRGNQSLDSVGRVLPGFTFAFQQADEVPKTLGIVPLN